MSTKGRGTTSGQERIVGRVGVTILTMPILTSSLPFCGHYAWAPCGLIVAHNQESVTLFHTLPHFSALFQFSTLRYDVYSVGGMI